MGYSFSDSPVIKFAGQRQRAHRQPLGDPLQSRSCLGSQPTRDPDFARVTLRAARQLASVHPSRVGELSPLIGPRDARWMGFGFNIPDDVTRPEVPEGLTVVNGAPGHLTVAWGITPRAGRFCLFLQVVGVDPQPVLVRTVADMDANLNTFTTGQHVRVQVTAVNGAGESLPCDPIEHVVP